jgi:23S rRNA pseudouridine1911/1915/1917 synthase
MPVSDGIDFRISSRDAQMRLDAVVALLLPDVSRSYAAALVRDGHIKVDQIVRKPSYKVKTGERLTGVLPEPEPAGILPEPIPIDLIHEDAHLIVLNKPAGLVVHPAAGHSSGTLVNGLLHHCPDLDGIGGQRRPGVVHRLDKDTSGIMLVAKTDRAHQTLSAQFKKRHIQKTYLALVQGSPKAPEGTIDLPIGRHPTDRKKISTISRHAREAVTVWRIRERFEGCNLLEVDLKTGRTHQIRVHCKAMGHPIVGDPVYGIRSPHRFAAKRKQALYQLLATARRQMLHAHQLTFTHPVSNELLSFTAPVAEDMEALLGSLRKLFPSQ